MPANSSLYTLRAAAGHPRLLDQANRVTEKEYPHGREDVMRSSVARIFAIVMLSVTLHAQKPRERDLKLPLPHQLKRIATRVSIGIGRQGGFGGNSPGDIFVAFSTANSRAWFNDQPVTDVKMLPNDRITPLFQATAQATEAAITNALLAAETTTGANDLRIYAMPVDRMLAAMKKYGR